MHNGTLGYAFGSNNTGKSDTLEFCEKILQPALLRWTGAEGKGDYTDEEFFRLVVDKQWVDSSTGLFCSNDLAPRRIGKNWSQYKHPDISSSGEVWVSNTLYFEKVSRGPMFQKLEAERKAAEAARAAQTSKKEVAPEHGGPFWEDHMDDHWGWPHQYPGHNGHPTTGGAQSGVGSNIRKWSDSNAAKSPKLLKAMSEVVNTWDFEDEEDIKELINLTQEEWYDIIEENHGEWFAIAMLGQILEHYNRMFIRNKFLENKLKKAEARIIAMKKGEEPNANSEAA
jgi:hypothetical protein